ncbi:hypothetical protein [Roseobacter sp. CCS2]|uniref:hypothetical protein n=1 Tax=Roseobacter sp. CCS2 TaxID=391593 RepID=UPI0000F3E0C6|nr:hypothetical protein [Roseobacter sp. CCS2]EBA12757.1 hypothetical protein RCCS2_15709 [Roseobacter sp. CCS2]
MGATKIATCCYCGTKAALVLRGKDKHELACSNCGAPLRALKMLPKQPGRAHVPDATPARPTKRKRVEKYPEYRKERPKKRKKSKGFGRRVMSEIWDVVEDVVEEIFD